MSLDTPKRPKKKQIKNKYLSNNIYILLFIYPLLIAVLFFMFISCTLSITCVHTQGIADDVADEQQTATPNVSPNIDVPISGV